LLNNQTKPSRRKIDDDSFRGKTVFQTNPNALRITIASIGHATYSIATLATKNDSWDANRKTPVLEWTSGSSCKKIWTSLDAKIEEYLLPVILCKIRRIEN